MQKVRIGQAVIFMMIVALVSSCAASKEYTSKLFAPRVPEVKDSQAVAKTLRFLDIDSADKNTDGWVSTDIIMGRDTLNTTALDLFATNNPANAVAKDSVRKNNLTTTAPVIADTKTTPVESGPVAKNANPGEVRNKKTRE